MTKENIEKRLSNWKTWVALFALVGLMLNAIGITGFEGKMAQVQEIVYTFGIMLGVWTDHDKGGDDSDAVK